MPSYSESEKLRLLLPHWIEHNTEHAVEFREWAGRVDEATGKILAAADQLEQANYELAQALELLGGPLAGHNHDYA